MTRGHMGWRGPFDAADDDEERDDPSCKHCGKEGLEWLHTGERWRLLDGIKPHVCDKAAAPDEFDP